MPLDPERVRTVFLELCDIDEPNRSVRLGELTDGDDELRIEVDRLLRHDRSEAQFLDGAWDVGAEAPDSSPHPVGMAGDRNALAGGANLHIPGFDLLNVIGEGGMGIVYRAQQHHPHRTVALKLVRHGFATLRQRQRFDVETDALARLRHPGIAQIHAAGVATLAGTTVPYLVMELVEGDPILVHRRAQGLSTNATLELLARVCDGVQHAHAHGVIHRDLKGSNILVTPSADGIGQPRILDFGVARIIGDERGTLTMPGVVVGTIGSMSPEQLGDATADVDTRCDVYALGTLLYELLAGAPPFDLEGRGIAEAARIVREREPRGLGQLNAGWRGDIETIVRTAMSKERERRYVSAAALAADLRRVLADEPILARTATVADRLRRTVRRHPVATALGLGAIVALAFLLTTIVRARGREAIALEIAERRTDALMDFLNDLTRESRSRQLAAPGTPFAIALDALSTRLLKTQAGPGREAREAELHETLGRRFLIDLGMSGLAERHLTRAIEFGLLSGDWDETHTAGVRRIRADALFSLERYDEAARELDAIIEYARRFHRYSYEAFAELLSQAGEAHARAARPERAVDLAREARTVAVTNGATVDSVIRAYVSEADALRAAGRWSEAMTALEGAREACDPAAARSYPLLPFQIEKGFLRLAKAQEQWDTIDPLIERCMAAARAYPGTANVSLVSAQLEAGRVERLRGDLVAAERWFRGALDACNDAAEYRPINALRVLTELCAVLRELPDRDEDLVHVEDQRRRVEGLVEGASGSN